jgi:hypothetical protein
VLSTQTLTHKEIKMSDFTPKLPEVKFNKNGYEIRTDILDMAKGLVTEEFHTKFRGWEMSVEKDEKTGQVVSTVAMPEFPGLDKVLETAEKMYNFVNQSTKK